MMGPKKLISLLVNATQRSQQTSALASGGWNIELVRQPARSPYLNVCDLSFNYSLLRAAESKTYHHDSLEALREHIVNAFWKYNEEHPGNLIIRQWGVLAHMFRLTLRYKVKIFPMRFFTLESETTHLNILMPL